MPKEHWKAEPEEHDFPAAESYLSLLLTGGQTDAVITGLRTASVLTRKAKDLLRASGLPVLPKDNIHVKNDLAKVGRGERLSPVLLLRGDLRSGRALVVADGYHRICASYYLDENADIPCKVADIG